MKSVVKWIFSILGGILGLVLVAGLVFYGMGQVRLKKNYSRSKQK